MLLVAVACGSSGSHADNAAHAGGAGGAGAVYNSAGAPALAGASSAGSAGTTNAGGGGGVLGSAGSLGTNGGSATALGGSSGQAGSGGAALTCPTPPAASDAYTVDASGVTFVLNPGRLRVQVCQDDIYRIQYTSAAALPTKTSLSVNASWKTPTFCVSESAGTVTIATARVKAKVNIASGSVSYTD
ncbi:MAG TPA: hypothetical protein VGJ91_12460, partial [Polyangiaceae bacterium]